MAASRVHGFERSEPTAHVPEQAELQQLAITQAAWLHAPYGSSNIPNQLALRPNLAYSLVLDDGQGTEETSGPVWTDPLK